MTAELALRVLVTGSRFWPWRQVICEALDGILERLPDPVTLVVVHGACPPVYDEAGMMLGADAIASNWAIEQGARLGSARVRQETHPADWDHCGPGCPSRAHRVRKKPGDVFHPGELDDYCPNAGPRRNRAMVATRPERWLGFVLNDSHGADGCVRLCRRARLNGRAWYGYDYPPPASAK